MKFPEVYNLRKSGIKVRVNHYRNFYKYDPKTGVKHIHCMSWNEKIASFPDYYLDPCGGKTTVTVHHPDYTAPIVGIVNCSNKDTYNKKVGTKKALARALSKIVESFTNYN